MQLIISHNILKGFGHSFIQASPIDISQIRVVSFNIWPPGYCLLLIPFILTGLKNIWVIAFSDALAIVIFYYCWYKILKICFKNFYREMIVFVFLFFTFGFTPLGMYYAYGSNIWSLVWFSLALQQLIIICQSINNPQWKSILLFYILSFLCCFFRFSYYPLSLLLSVAFLYFFYKKPAFNLIKKSFIIPILLFGLFFLFQYLQVGSLNYLGTLHPNNGINLHWSHLTKTTPFIANSFLFPIQYHGANWFLSVYDFIHDFSVLKNGQIINTIIKLSFTLVLFILLVVSMCRKIGEAERKYKQFFLFTILLILGQLFFLVFLSLLYPYEIFKGINSISKWTYVEEVRYYNAINLMILVSGIWALLSYNRKLSYLIFLFIFSYNIWTYYQIKSDLSPDPIENITQKNFWVVTETTDSMLAENAVFYEKELKERKYNYHFISYMYAEKGIPILKYISPSHLKTSKPVTLIIAIDNIENEIGDSIFKQLITKNKSIKLGNMFDSKIEIWAIKFKPHQTLNL